MIAALGGRHGVPTGAGERLALEGRFQDGRQFAFAFHDEQEPFGNFFSALLAGFGGVGLADEGAHGFAGVVAEAVEPFAESAILLQGGGQLWRDLGGAFFEIGLKANADFLAGCDAGG